MSNRLQVESFTVQFQGGATPPIEVTVDQQVAAVYVRVRRGKVARTIEEKPGLVLVDVDESGRLLGFEVIGSSEGQIRLVGEKYASEGVEREALARADAMVAAASQ